MLDDRWVYSILYTSYVVYMVYIHTRIIDPLDDYWLNTCPIGTPISSCSEMYLYKSISI